MAISEHASGSEAVSTTEWSCTTDTAGPDVDTTDGVFQVFIQVSDMVTGDELQIRIYEKVQSTDTQRICYEATLIGPQSPSCFVTPTFVLMHGWDVTLDAIAGTITVYWVIKKVV